MLSMLSTLTSFVLHVLSIFPCLFSIFNDFILIFLVFVSCPFSLALFYLFLGTFFLLGAGLSFPRTGSHVNYTNLVEINSSSSMFVQTDYSGDTIVNPAPGPPSLSHVLATARGVFGAEGGSLVSSETGVSILVPPGAIEEGHQQEIFFNVCHDAMAPPLDKEKGK